jgi:hypothetical protein
MIKNLNDSLEGAGIGLLAGLVIGISDSDWIRLAIVFALFAYAGKDLLRNKKDSTDSSYKTTFTGIASFLAVIIGLYINGQRLFRESPKEAVSEWINAGYSPEQARVLYLKKIEKDHENKDSVSPLMQSLIQTIIKSSGKDSLPAGKDSIINN